VAIVAFSLWYTNILVRKISNAERDNVRIWAETIHKKAELVNYTDQFFMQIQDEERKRMELMADAYRIVSVMDESDVLSFFLKFISENSTIPVVLTDAQGKIKSVVNVDFDKDTVSYLKGDLRAEFMVYPPVKIEYSKNQHDFLFYKNSRLFSELRGVINDLTESFLSEIVINSASVPVIITDSSMTRVLEYGLLEPKKTQDSAFIMETLEDMAFDNDPLEISIPHQGKRYIFYQDSELLTRMMIFPYLQLGIIAFFLFIAYVMFSSARRSEQNQVWVGLAKETAHQLGTPLSSMIAWIELLKMEGVENETIIELNKDVDRLRKITERFSKIGSAPRMKSEDIVKVLYDSVSYLRFRASRKVKYQINLTRNESVIVPINLHLFEWVIENLCKNAIDAIGGEGNIMIDVKEEENLVIVDIADDGKGIPKSKFKTIFDPGYTSKKRGWGLGLSLAKRIIKEYHNGKIFVKSSVLNKGTVFRIVLKKDQDN